MRINSTSIHTDDKNIHSLKHGFWWPSDARIIAVSCHGIEQVALHKSEFAKLIKRCKQLPLVKCVQTFQQTYNSPLHSSSRRNLQREAYVDTGLILGLRPANKRRRCNVTPSLIGWAQTQNPPWYNIIKTRNNGCVLHLNYFNASEISVSTRR